MRWYHQRHRTHPWSRQPQVRQSQMDLGWSSMIVALVAIESSYAVEVPDEGRARLPHIQTMDISAIPCDHRDQGVGHGIEEARHGFFPKCQVGKRKYQLGTLYLPRLPKPLAITEDRTPSSRTSLTRTTLRRQALVLETRTLD